MKRTHHPNHEYDRCYQNKASCWVKIIQQLNDIWLWVEPKVHGIWCPWHCKLTMFFPQSPRPETTQHRKKLRAWIWGTLRFGFKPRSCCWPPGKPLGIGLNIICFIHKKSTEEILQVINNIINRITEGLTQGWHIGHCASDHQWKVKRWSLCTVTDTILVTYTTFVPEVLFPVAKPRNSPWVNDLTGVCVSMCRCGEGKEMCVSIIQQSQVLDPTVAGVALGSPAVLLRYGLDTSSNHKTWAAGVSWFTRSHYVETVQESKGSRHGTSTKTSNVHGSKKGTPEDSCHAKSTQHEISYKNT